MKSLVDHRGTTRCSPEIALTTPTNYIRTKRVHWRGARPSANAIDRRTLGVGQSCLHFRLVGCIPTEPKAREWAPHWVSTHASDGHPWMFALGNSCNWFAAACKFVSSFDPTLTHWRVAVQWVHTLVSTA
jgi:hypothetical protein